MKEQQRDFVEVPGDLDPMEPSIAYGHMESGNDALAAHFFQIWIDEYHEIYKHEEGLRNVLGAAHCDMATSLMAINQMGNMDKCIHSYLEGISLNTSTIRVATHNLAILMRTILFVKSCDWCEFDKDDMNIGSWQWQSSEAWDCFKRNNYSGAHNLYRLALEKYVGQPRTDSDAIHKLAIKKNVGCLPLLHSYAFAKFGAKCAPDADSVPIDIVDILMDIHLEDSSYKYHMFQVPTRKLEQVTAKKTGPCFIATSVCGSADSLEVQQLQVFRDEILMKTAVGRRVVQGYYRVSPSIAATISRSNMLRRLLYFTFIRPI